MRYLTISELPEPVRDQIICRASDLNKGRVVLPNNSRRYDMLIILRSTAWANVRFGVAEFVLRLNVAGPPIQAYIWTFDRLKVDDEFPLDTWYAEQKK